MKASFKIKGNPLHQVVNLICQLHPISLHQQEVNLHCAVSYCDHLKAANRVKKIYFFFRLCDVGSYLDGTQHEIV